MSLEGITRIIIIIKITQQSHSALSWSQKLLKIICKSIFKILQDGGHLDSGLVGNFLLYAEVIK